MFLILIINMNNKRINIYDYNWVYNWYTIDCKTLLIFSIQFFLPTIREEVHRLDADAPDNALWKTKKKKQSGKEEEEQKRSFKTPLHRNLSQRRSHSDNVTLELTKASSSFYHHAASLLIIMPSGCEAYRRIFHDFLNRT